MGIIEDVLKALDRVPLWKRLNDVPREVDDLRARLDALEARLDGKTGQLCPICNAPTFKRTAAVPDRTFGDMGVMMDTFQCSDCGHQENHRRDVAGRAPR